MSKRSIGQRLCSAVELLNVALQILGLKFYKNTKKTSSCSQSLSIFIHETLVVENHPTIRGSWRNTTAWVDPNGNHGLFLHEQLAHVHTGNTKKKVSNMFWPLKWL